MEYAWELFLVLLLPLLGGAMDLLKNSQPLKAALGPIYHLEKDAERRAKFAGVTDTNGWAV